MQSLQFLSRMALAGKAMVQAPTEFRLPLGIVLFSFASGGIPPVPGARPGSTHLRLV